jgi:hypothetical protein
MENIIFLGVEFNVSSTVVSNLPQLFPNIKLQVYLLVLLNLEGDDQPFNIFTTCSPFYERRTKIPSNDYKL